MTAEESRGAVGGAGAARHLDRKLRKVLRDLDAQVAALPDTEGAADATDVGGSDVGVTGGAGALM